jgi:hypothetical protein
MPDHAEIKIFAAMAAGNWGRLDYVNDYRSLTTDGLSLKSAAVRASFFFCSVICDHHRLAAVFLHGPGDRRSIAGASHLPVESKKCEQNKWLKVTLQVRPSLFRLDKIQGAIV